MRSRADVTLPVTLLLSLCACSPDNNRRTIDAPRDSVVRIGENDRVILSRVHGRDGAAVRCVEPSRDLPERLVQTVAPLLARKDNPPGVRSEADVRSEKQALDLLRRSQNLQMMREALFRSCEAYANGAMDRVQYEGERRRSMEAFSSLARAELIMDRAPPIDSATLGSLLAPPLQAQAVATP